MKDDLRTMADEIDLRLIHGLQENPRVSYVALARAVGVSEATVRRRVQRLFNEGIIRSIVVADLDALDFTVRAMAGIKVDPSQAETIAKQLSDFPNVTYVARTLGRYDVICFVAQHSITALSEFLTVELSTIAGVHDIEIILASKTLKNLPVWRVPVEGHQLHTDEALAVNPDSSIQIDSLDVV